MTVQIKDKILVKERGKRILIFILLKVPLDTAWAEYISVHVSFKHVHEVHIFNSWDLNLQPPSLEVVRM